MKNNNSFSINFCTFRVLLYTTGNHTSLKLCNKEGETEKSFRALKLSVIGYAKYRRQTNPIKRRRLRKINKMATITEIY